MKRIFWVVALIFVFNTFLYAGIGGNLVLGQTDFISISSGTNNSKLNNPFEIAIDTSNDRIYVCDTGNSRVLWWEGINSLSNGESADGVIGQADLNSGQANRGGAITANTLSHPQGIYIDCLGNVWVSDTWNNRVLKYNKPTTNGENAVLVLGQEDFSTSYYVTKSSRTLYYPAGIYVEDSGNVWVADSSNNRVLKYENITANGQGAVLVLGQDNFNTGFPSVSLNSPRGISLDGSGNVWVANPISAHSSIVKFINPSTNKSAADLEIYHNFPNEFLKDVSDILFDNSGNLWALGDYLLKYSSPVINGSSLSLRMTLKENFKEFIPAIKSYGFECDANGNIWIAHSNENRVVKYNITGVNQAISISSVTPTFGFKGSTVAITVTGTGFVEGMKVEMTEYLSAFSNGQTIAVNNANIVNSNTITYMMDLTNTTTGNWKIILTSGPFRDNINIMGESDGTEFFGVCNTPEIIISSVTPNIVSQPYFDPIFVNMTSNINFGGYTIKLRKNGYQDIVPVFYNFPGLSASFSLMNETTGYWDIVVTPNGYDEYAQVLSSALFVNPPPAPEFTLVSISPNSVSRSAFVNLNISVTDYVNLNTASVKLCKSGELDINSGSAIFGASTIMSSFDLTNKATGYWDVVVIPNGLSQYSKVLSSGVYIRLYDLNITSMTPNMCYTNDILPVEIFGSGFTDNSEVKLVKGTETIQSGFVSNWFWVNKLMTSFNLFNKATGYWDLVVSTGGVGSYYVTLSSAVNIRIPMQVTSISPVSALEEMGVFNMTIEGMYFMSGSTVALINASGGIINADNVVVISTRQINCSFSVTGKTLGDYGIKITSGTIENYPFAYTGFTLSNFNIYSASPNYSFSGSNLGLHVLGSGINTSSNIRLVKSGEPDIVGNVIYVDIPNVACNFEVPDTAATGYWNIVVSTGSISEQLENAIYIYPRQVSSITPNTALNTEEVSVVLNGNYFKQGSEIGLIKSGSPNIMATNINIVSSNTITCKFNLANKTTGFWTVVVSSYVFGSMPGEINYINSKMTNGFFISAPSVIVSTPVSLAITTTLPNAGYNTEKLNGVMIIGQLFTANSIVKLTKSGENDLIATNVYNVVPQWIQCSFDLTGKATGYWNVVVSSGGVNSSSTTLTNGFCILPMKIASIIPDNYMNTESAGISIITGEGFVNDMVVKLAKSGESDILATNINVSSQTIVCSFNLTGKATGYWDLVVSRGGLGAMLQNGFFIAASTYSISSSTQTVSVSSATLSIGSIFPAVSFNNGNLNVNISGTAFEQQATVKLKKGSNEITASSINVVSSSLITCTFDLLDKTTGYWDVVMSTGGTEIILAQGFEVKQGLRVNIVVPAYGYNNGVAIVGISGKAIANGSNVSLIKDGQNSISVSTITYISDESILCYFDLKDKATGFWTIYISSENNQGSYFQNYFEIKKRWLITSVSPECGYKECKHHVMDIAGSDFIEGLSTKLIRTGFDDISASSMTFIDSGKIRCVFDLCGKTTGYWDMVVSTNMYSSVFKECLKIKCPISKSEIINPNSNTSVSALFETGETKIDIPAGCFGSNVVLAVSTTTVPVSTKSTIKVTNIGIEIINDQGLQPEKEITITINYRDEDVNGFDEAKLTVARYEPSIPMWITLPSTVDTVNNKIIGRTNHLSKFAVVQLAPAPDLSGVKVYPNPFKPGINGSSIIFDELPANAKIKIFNIAGELLYNTTDDDGDGRISWDGRNNSGSLVASGIYIAYIESSNGAAKIKFALLK